MRLNLSLSQKALILIAVPLAFQLVFVFTLDGLRRQVEQEEAEAVHARDVYRHLDRMLRNVMDRATQVIVVSVNKSVGIDDKHAQQRLDSLLRNIQEEADASRKFTANDPRERSQFEECDRLQERLMVEWQTSNKALKAGDNITALREFRRLQFDEQLLMVQCDKFIAAERDIESMEVDAGKKHRDEIDLLIKFAVLLNVLLAVGLALFFNVGTTKRLNVLMQNIVRLAGNADLNEPLKGEDELAKLDQTFHRMAEALALAARQERAIIDKTVDVICSLNSAGRFTRVSPAAREVWGYDPDDLLARNYSDLLAEADRERVLAAMKEVKSGVREEPIEAQVVRKDGRPVDTMWSVRWSPEDQTIFCVAHDITARKQAEKILKEAEARVRLIVESLPIGLLIIDSDGQIEFSNPRVSEMFGFAADQLSGEQVGKLFREKKQSAVSSDLKGFAKELFSRALNEPWELEAVKYNGGTFPSEVNLTEFGAINGSRYLVVIIDISQKHAIEQMRQEFIAMISHDLRSPIASVQTFLDLLETGICGDLNEKGEQRLKAAYRNIDRLLDLIRDLLDLEKYRSGIFIIDKKEISLQTVIDKSVDAVKLQAENLGIEITVEVEDATLQADEGRLVQVGVNLLSNSLKFSPKGSTISISAKTAASWVELRINDQGRGISARDQARIFERFEQVKEDDEDSKRGSGLGLPICKAIIEQHGGSIGVESEKGKGSSFWLRLPILGKSPVW